MTDQIVADQIATGQIVTGQILMAESFFSPSHLGVVKSIAFVFFFSFFSTWQMARPHQNKKKKYLRNWLVNIGLGLINSLVVFFLFGGRLADWIRAWQESGFGLLGSVGIHPVAKILVTIIILDFVTYFLHRFYHLSDFFWRFHWVHHSDAVFETSTALRFHAIEVLFSLVIKLVLVRFLGLPLEGWVAYEIVFMAMNFCQHSDFSLPDWLEKKVSLVFITPTLHRLHHSVEAHRMNSNYATIFGLWDLVFKSRSNGKSQEIIEVGIKNSLSNFALRELLIRPFKSEK